jgi:hypothetical protein
MLIVFKINLVYKCFFLCYAFLVLVGIAETSTATGIDAMNPSSKEEFDELQTAISKKIQSYTKSPHFPAFAEDLIRNICVNCKYTNENFNQLRKKIMYEINII